MRALSSFLLHVPGPGEEISNASVRQANHCTPSDGLTITETEIRRRGQAFVPDKLDFCEDFSSVSFFFLSLMSFGSDLEPIVLSGDDSRLYI